MSFSIGELFQDLKSVLVKIRQTSLLEMKIGEVMTASKMLKAKDDFKLSES